MIYSQEETTTLPQQRFAFIRVEEQEHTLRIVLNRPKARNAMNPTMIREFAYAMSYAHHHAHIWTVVFAAEGKIWCAGADLKAMRGQEEEHNSSIPAPRGEIVIGELFADIHRPVIAEVHAPVYAGGHLLIAGCTQVVATPAVSFHLPEVKRGLFPYQVMDMLLKVLPARKVLDWCIRGGNIRAEEALRLGLVTELVSEGQLRNQVQALVNLIHENSPSAIRLGLKAYQALKDIPEAGKQAFLKQMHEETIQTQDAQEGLKAFAEKRKAQWIGS